MIKYFQIFNLLLKFFVVISPWRIKILLLTYFFGYKIEKDAKIGLSWFFPKNLIMGRCAVIGHLNVCKGLRLVDMGNNSSIGNLNWITGFPENFGRHFICDSNRVPCLIIGEHSAISSRHLIDCTDSITIGRFSTIGGFRSQLMTHSINIMENMQRCIPITIGDYCFISTNSVVIGGSIIPDYSVVSACTFVNKKLDSSYFLYGGVPVKSIKPLDLNYKYFTRSTGYVD